MIECPGECTEALGVWAKMWFMITQDGMQKLKGRGKDPGDSCCFYGLAIVTSWEGSVLRFGEGRTLNCA